MSETTLEAKEQLIEAQAEAAKAEARLEETQVAEIAAVIENTPAATEVIEEEEVDECLESINALRQEVQQLREQLAEQSKQLSTQLLASMTEVFQTAIAGIAIAQSTPQPSQTPVVVENQPEPVNVAVTPESSAVPVVEEPKNKRRRI